MRGDALTRRMLDFARTGNDGGHPASVADPADTVAGMCELLSRTTGPDLRLRCRVEPAWLPERVRGSRAELEAAVMNLVANARDAMKDGGEIFVLVESERVVAPHPAGLKPGLYARVSVIDTGEGMPPEVLARAGEPFFTTKPRGKGTGLGLSAVRGFAETAGGAMRVESAPGRGTTVTLWLPDAAATRDEPSWSGDNITPLRPSA
jgi:signal transduction histidine kinase